MFEYFTKGLIFTPVYACIVYAVIFIINWKRLHVSQRIFTFSLFAMVCCLLLFECIILEDMQICKWLVFMNSFTGPALVVLFFLFTYSQMQTKSIFRPRLWPILALPVLSLLLLVAGFICGSDNERQINEIAYSVIYSTSDPDVTWLVKVQYLLYRLILIIGSVCVAIYFIYKIKWFGKLAEQYMADSDSAVMPMSKQLTLTFLLFVTVTAAQFFKKVVPEEYYIVGAELYGAFMVGMIIHTCRAVHHGYTRMPLEGEEVEKMDAEMQFLYDSFDERTWSLAGISKEPTESQETGGKEAKIAEVAAYDSDDETAAEHPEDELIASKEAAKSAEISAETSKIEAEAADAPESSETTAEANVMTAEANGTKVEANATEGEAESEKKDVVSYVQSSEIEQELKKVMIVKKLYLQQNITIKDVANAIGTNHYYLSVYLNRVLNTTFSDYINRLRIEREVLPRIAKNSQVSTKQLIVAGNFSHRTTFYRAFQKVMGVTFQEYKEALKTP